MTRREALLAAAAAMMARAQAEPAFFTPEEFAAADELTEMILPADAHSPGAHAAAVPAYIDQELAESFDPAPRALWREGLKPFLKVSREERLALLRKAAVNEFEPKTPAERFFHELKTRTVHAYYTSKIGIHQEMEYKGNVYLEKFVGYEVGQAATKPR